MRFSSRKWAEPIIVALIIVAWFSGVALGILAWHTPAQAKASVRVVGITPTINVNQLRDRISFPPYVSGKLNELPPIYNCEGFHAKAPTGTEPAWVLILCAK